MNRFEMFGEAKWIGTGCDDDIPVIFDSFAARCGEKAEITILGFGVFKLYINGKRAHDTEFLPLATDYEHNDFPSGELLAHRVYPEVFDISNLIIDGDNTIAVMLGNGWYNKPVWEESKGDGRKKVCYRITLSDGDKAREHLSGESAVWAPSPVTYNHYNHGEEQDLRLSLPLDKIPSESRPVIIEDELRDTEYLFSDCPRDKRVRRLTPTLIRDGEYKLYDIGINTTGYPILRVTAKKGEKVELIFAEKLSGDNLSEMHIHSQRFNVISDGEELEVCPYFGWLAARYVRLVGDGELIGFDEIYADVETTVSFESDTETLNYIFNTFLHTQLINMHTGIPSDCPQLERRGYTGDGQLIAHAAMLFTGSRKFYRKWLYDISDCQDRITGHVQYTAPYTLAGGGPGGWGSAMVSVPYEFYLRFKDLAPAKEMYPQMHRYLDYLDAHSEGLLVTSDREGLWCLGDWCTPGPVILPAPFVNNYFYVKSCMTMIKIARLTGNEADIPALEKRIADRKRAIDSAYMNPWDGNYLGGSQGANAFALDIGLGDERTKKNFISRYDALGYYDTGIFGTEIVTRLLFEYGRGDIAVRLLCQDEPHGYGRFMKEGYTTLPEYWIANPRSCAHPMFGAVAAHLIDYVLGIRQADGCTGYEDIVISPLAYRSVKRASGHIVNMKGERIEVSYSLTDGVLTVDTFVPDSTHAVLRVKDESVTLPQGRSSHSFRVDF